MILKFGKPRLPPARIILTYTTRIPSLSLSRIYTTVLLYILITKKKRGREIERDLDYIIYYYDISFRVRILTERIKTYQRSLKVYTTLKTRSGHSGTRIPYLLRTSMCKTTQNFCVRVIYFIIIIVISKFRLFIEQLL